jgi:hypothetical protein
MRGFAAQFFRNIPSAVGLNVMVALGSATAFLLGYELLMLVKFFGFARSLQTVAGLAVLVGTTWLLQRAPRSLWRKFRQHVSR